MDLICHSPLGSCIPMFRLWLHDLYGPRCLSITWLKWTSMSESVKLNHSFTGFMLYCMCSVMSWWHSSLGSVSVAALASLWPSDVIWCHRSWSTLDQVMAWCLNGTKPLSDPMLICHHWTYPQKCPSVTCFNGNMLAPVHNNAFEIE